MSEIKQNPWCSQHQGKQNRPCERCFAYLNDSKSKVECQIPLFAYNGRKVASLWGKTLVKIVKGTKHMLHHPIGWACDSMVVTTAKNMGAQWFHILDKETKDIYECRLEDFFEKGLNINRGYGDQIVLPIQFWKILQPEEIKNYLKEL